MSIPDLDFIFHPRAVAVVGVSNEKPGAGHAYIHALRDYGYRGNIYAVNPRGGETLGLKIYHSLSEIPEPVDHVISVIPAQFTPGLMHDCAAKGVKTVHFFTSGFSELGSEEGNHLQAELLGIARQNGIRVLGPNCMGMYCPATGLSFSINLPEQHFPRESGHIGFFGQSGGYSIYFVQEAGQRGLRFSKAISFGNAADLNECDFLEYFAEDAETKIITTYLEGVRDGRRFFRALEKAAARKPVIVFKAGTTDSGRRTAASHTGSLAGSSRLWESLLKQAGAIQVHSIEEIADIALLFTLLSPPKGRKLAVIGSGGGASVQAADECARAGLELPSLPTTTRQRLREIYSTESGHIFTNPVDTLMKPELMPETMRAIAGLDEVDMLLLHVAYDTWALFDKKLITEPTIKAMVGAATSTGKPVVVALSACASAESRKLAMEASQRLFQAGLPVFPSTARAATALSRFISYYDARCPAT